MYIDDLFEESFGLQSRASARFRKAQNPFWHTILSSEIIKLYCLLAFMMSAGLLEQK